MFHIIARSFFSFLVMVIILILKKLVENNRNKWATFISYFLLFRIILCTLFDTSYLTSDDEKWIFKTICTI